MAQTAEGKVKSRCKLVFKQHGVWFYMPMQNGLGVVGIPDFICCVRGLFLGIETKAPGKRDNLSPNQLARREEILAAGGEYHVVDDPEQLRAILEPSALRRWAARVFYLWRQWKNGEEQESPE